MLLEVNERSVAEQAHLEVLCLLTEALELKTFVLRSHRTPAVLEASPVPLELPVTAQLLTMQAVKTVSARLMGLVHLFIQTSEMLDVMPSRDLFLRRQQVKPASQGSCGKEV
jgi:hypothetical protein